MTAGDEKKKTGKKPGGDTAEDIEAKINEIIIEGASGKEKEQNKRMDLIFFFILLMLHLFVVSAGTKMEVDYTDVTDKKVPEAQALAKAGKLTEGIDLLMSLEKQTRTGGDMHSTSKILVCIVQMCYEVMSYGNNL